MEVRIVVEGKTDAALIERILEKQRNRFKIVTADGKDAARPIVRTILIQYRAPTAFVFDTDTVDKIGIDDELRALTDYLSSRASEALFILIPMVPEIESLLFNDDFSVIRSRLEGKLDPAVEAAARVAPKAVLHQLLPRLNFPDEISLIRALSPKEIACLARSKEIERLRRFIEQMA